MIISKDITSRKIGCIASYLEKVPGGKQEFLDFLASERLGDIDSLRRCLFNSDLAQDLYLILKRSLDSNAISMFDFEWIFLPKEVINITVVGKRGTTCFSTEK